jgi:diaminopropionate ammonia-lyase
VRLRLDLNPRARGADAVLLDPASMEQAAQTIARWPGYAPTPLVELARWAATFDVAALTVKHEGGRFGVGSFKALGPPYALACTLARRLGRDVDAVASGAAREGAGRFTAVAATSGNHGRALAWGAARIGCAATIFMPAHTSAGREAAIRGFGACVVRVPGDFPASLAAARAAASRPDHVLIADVPFDDADTVPRDTILGYATLARELAAQTPAPLTHVFVAAGIGSLVAAVAAGLRHARGAAAPLVVAVEPLASDAVRRSIAAGAPVRIAGAMHSVMDGLVVDAVSPAAWPILRDALDAGLAIPDADAIATLRDAARGRHGDAPLEIGETGIAALAGAVAAARVADVRRALGIGPASRLLAIACEGVTDRAVFDALVAGEGAEA